MSQRARNLPELRPLTRLVSGAMNMNPFSLYNRSGLVPTDQCHLVQTLYGWGARNVEMCLFQVGGEFQPFAGVSIPSFLPATG